MMILYNYSTTFPGNKYKKARNNVPAHEIRNPHFSTVAGWMKLFPKQPTASEVAFFDPLNILIWLQNYFLRRGQNSILHFKIVQLFSHPACFSCLLPGLLRKNEHCRRLSRVLPKRRTLLDARRRYYARTRGATI